VLVERIARDRQRIVDPDRLAGDLLAVLEDREVGREVGGLAGLEAGCLEVEVLDQEQAGRADRLDRQGLALGDDQALLLSEALRHRGRLEEGDQPEVGQQGRHLRVLVAVAVEVADAATVGRLADVEAVSAEDGRHPSAGTPSMAALSGRRGSKKGSGWATRISRTPRHSFGVRSRVQTVIDRTNTTSAALNHAERKIAKTDRRSSESTRDAPISGS
jgi:hypothetical protein